MSPQQLTVSHETCTVWDMTAEEAEQMLTEWVTVTRDRDNRVRWAVSAGVSKYRVSQLTGIGRSTIDRILARLPRPQGPAMGHLEADSDH